jgi:hypothetical protein
MQTTYNDIQELIERKKEFHGNSAHAEWLEPEVVGSNLGRLGSYEVERLRMWMDEHPSAEYYVVYSYDTPMMVKNNIGHSWMNFNKYSSTTSRLQNIIKQTERV